MKKLFVIVCLTSVGLSAAATNALAQRRGAQITPQQISQARNRQRQNPPPNQRRQERLPGNQINRDPSLRENSQPGRALRPAEARRQIQQQAFQAIGLTSDQRLRMENIHHRFEDDIIAAGRRVREARRALESAIMSEDFNESLINQRVESLAAAEADRVRIQFRRRTEIRSVMTSEQIRRFNQFERRLRRQLREQRQMQGMSPFIPPDSVEAEEADLISLLFSKP